MLSKLREFDFYRRIPKDLTEGSLHGSLLSFLAFAFLIGLFTVELRYRICGSCNCCS